jgi:hypothetical protein
VIQLQIDSRRVEPFVKLVVHALAISHALELRQHVLHRIRPFLKPTELSATSTTKFAKMEYDIPKKDYNIQTYKNEEIKILIFKKLRYAIAQYVVCTICNNAICQVI